MVTLVRKLIEAQENKLITIGVFLDFSKAFDTVNYTILFMKLYHYGVRGTALDWLKCYLHNRSQFVQFDNITSTNENITTALVPQGSILGPLLFLLYINDIAKISSVLIPILFADDSNFFFSGESVEDITNLVNIEMDKIVLWLKVNKLSLNVKKVEIHGFP